ncbi:MAG: prepilin-type N-terminal cleavage/methylation domain-containing protein [Deferribacteraceae bacterium]|jgi:prepilin-type N-terminal cleavage/methylation domain-containing protein|nr:prepilin-type N-terminal cleavage/methylation domain-containing protein [Deferribacteraceae bacterium]
MMFRNVKKGFTFVELAIVLVIIGIIMGMAIKGRQLIEGAKTRSEVRKLEKIQSAVAGWISNTGGDSNALDFRRLNPSATCSSTVARGSIVASNTKVAANGVCLDSSLLNDITTSTISNPYGDNWTLWAGGWPSKGAEVAPGTAFLAISSSSPRFGCNMENMLDDKFFNFGDVRSGYNEHRVGDSDNGTTPADNTSVNNVFKTCDEWPNNADNSSYVGYELGL